MGMWRHPLDPVVDGRGGDNDVYQCRMRGDTNRDGWPYPSLVDLFRSDIREWKSGTLLALTIRVVNAASGCAAVPNANAEIWHVDAAGNYSQ